MATSSSQMAPSSPELEHADLVWGSRHARESFGEGDARAGVPRERHIYSGGAPGVFARRPTRLNTAMAAAANLSRRAPRLPLPLQATTVAAGGVHELLDLPLGQILTGTA